MNNYLARIKKLKQKLQILRNENFVAATSGTHHKVFISNNYVIRFRDDNPDLLSRESKFLQQCHHSLIPIVVWAGSVDKKTAMIERRLTGTTIDTIWKKLSTKNKKNIIADIIKFLKYLQSQKRNEIYSVNTGKHYNNFLNYLIASRNQNLKKLKPSISKYPIIKNIIVAADITNLPKIITANKKTALVHGDLIIHNLLTDGKNLTGVLDWELALVGDSDYDLCRLYYYQECAKAYQEQGIDDTFEVDYLNHLLKTISKSNLIKNKKIFLQKYQFYRAIFYLNALTWAADSKNPPKNTKELIKLWNQS